MMNRLQFDRCVARVMESLPEAFAPYLDNLVVDVEDEADEATLRDVGLTDDEIADGDTIYGLFIPSEFDSGDGLGGVDGHDQPPHRIVIYRRPLLEDFPDRRDLRIEIRKTVVHELAHHFGWTDRDLEGFDNDPDPFGDE
ncbi:MAG: metallopeptidase family protein [Gemmataceae bacterium]|nr:metallopeptidase family protein [Gemmataceae bacterium]